MRPTNELGMKFYAITQKKEHGCPIGLLNAVLYDHCPEDSTVIEHGIVYPWYSDPKGLNEFPEGMCLVAKEKLIDFSIRSISSNQFLDQYFLEALTEFNAPLKDFKGIDVVSYSDKKTLSRKNTSYPNLQMIFIVRCQRLQMKVVVP